MGTSVCAIRISRLFYCALSVTKCKCTIIMYACLICKASVYKLFSELFLVTSCLLYADTVPLIG